MADGSRTANYEEALASWRADTQFAVDYSKGYLGLEHAYARGLSGAGVTVGINDSGIYWDHPLFAGRANGLDTGTSDSLGNFGSISSTEPWHTHGTHVAGTAVGRRLAGERMFGNAYGATVYSSTAHFIGSNFAYSPERFSGRPIADSMDNLIATAVGGHARIINNSWGSSQRAIRYDASLDDITTYYERYNEEISQQNWEGVLANDTLIVMSAGNDTLYHASMWNMTPHYVPEMKDNFVTVTNYTSADTQNNSNLCGATATWCVTGPGTDIISSIPDFSFNQEAWTDTYDYNIILNDDLFMVLYDLFGLETAIRYTHLSMINTFIEARDEALEDGTPFDSEAEMRNLASNIATFSKRFLSLFNNLKPLIGIDVQYLTINLINLVGGKLSNDEAIFIANAYNDDMLTTLRAHMGEVEGGYEAMTGTSMAAPNITGFAALLLEQFPEYNTALITDIMLSSGRDIEEEGVDIRAGWGVPQMGTALDGPSALRAVREVRVGPGTRDTWSNDITDAIDKYSPLVLERNPDDIGGLIKIGGGELILTGNNTYSGETRVREGLLTLDGALTRSTLTVQDVGIISGTGTLATLIADSGGVVAPGNSANPFGTLTVSGNATFLPGSFLWVRANLNAAQYSKLAVEGATTLEGGNVIVKADNGVWNLRNRGMAILTSAGGVTGQFEGVTSDLGFLTPSLTYEANTVLLKLLRNDVPIASAGKNANERNTGAALDVMTANNTSGNLALEDAILDGSFEAVSKALPYLTGEVHAALGGLTAANASYVREAMLDRGRTMPNSTSVEQALNGRGVTAWASGIFGNGQFDGNEDYRPYRNETNGFAAGIDARLGQNSLIGAAIGQTRSDLKLNALRSTGKSTTTQIGVYGATQIQKIGLRAGGTWIDSDYDTTRSVALNRFSDRLVGDYGGDGWQAWAEASAAFATGATTVEPYLNYTHYKFEANMVEKGGDAALKGTLNHKADLLTAGLRTSTLVVNGSDRPQVRLVGHLAYTENLSDDGLNLRARFSDGPGFDISGAQPMDGGITVGAGVNIRATQSLSFDVGYSGLHNSDFQDNRVYGRMSLRF